jgi:hypothetical protein
MMFLSGFVLREEPCTDPYARFCGQTEASVSSDPIDEASVAWMKRSEIRDIQTMKPVLQKASL